MSSYFSILLVAVSLCGVSLALYEDCENPPAVKHASIQIEDDDDSVHAFYTCPQGYELSGPNELICNIDTDEWNTDPPSCVKNSDVSNEVESENQRRKKPLDIVENRKVSAQMAATLDMSCVQAKVKAPEIRYGYVQKYDRQRTGDRVYLVAFYGCNDNFEFEDSEITEVYCSERTWVGELPACISLGEYDEEEDEYDEYDTVDEEDGLGEDEQEEGNDIDERHRETTHSPQHTTNPTQSTARQHEPEEMSNEIEPRRRITSQDATRTMDAEDRVSGVESATDINTVVQPTHDPYTPRLLDQECGPDNGGCEHKCERLLFPGENEPRLKCSCFDGFSLDPYDYSRCHDIDECQANNGGCEQVCNNIPGSYQCSCEEGLQIDTLTDHTCVDINECLLRNGHGPCQDVCYNYWAGYRCSCDNLPGTQLAQDNHTCEDTGECLTKNGGCSHICLPSSLGRIFCICPSGFTMSNDTKNCLDINECEIPEISTQCLGGCENTHGSFRCIPALNSRENSIEAEVTTESNQDKKECPHGYELTATNECKDIDECAAGISNCEHCLNTDGGYECACPPGYDLGDDGHNCIDINECDILVEDEDTNDGVPYKICPQGCFNTPGSFICQCAAHEHLLDDRRTCAPDSCHDLNNPALEKTRCAYQCQDLESGGYTCVCPAGYALSADGHNCEVAENPCSSQGGYEQCAPGSCNANEDSTSYSCNCPEGYANEGYKCGEIDECAEETHRCSHECINTDSGYQCSCPSGYRFAEGSVEQCEDIDECQLEADICGAQVCLNLPGSFMCVCADGSEPNSETGLCENRTVDHCAQNNGGCSHMCVNQPDSVSCMCPNGMQLSEDGLNCVYEDLCAENNGGCDHLCSEGRCECKSGFMLGQDGKSCADIDECSINNGDCHQLCHNYEGSYECACDVGFELASDRRTCVDVDECALRRHDCSHECVNLAGGYECTCPRGYVLGENKATCLESGPVPVDCPLGTIPSEDGINCLPLSSCSVQNGGCSHHCDDITGCSCPTGMELSSNDDKTCEDINECLLNNGGCSHMCINSMGSYECACPNGAELMNTTHCATTCPVGFINNPIDSTSCIDIDECATPDICQYSCRNNNGSYECTCPEGYLLRNGRECEDIDECLVNNGGCKGSGKCINHNGSYQCRCPAGFRLGTDRHTCDRRPEIRDQCSPFVAPLNGEIHCTKFRHKKKMFYNTRCKIWCNEGYRLEGPSVRHCDASGLWDKYENECLPIVCPRLPTPLNGVILPPSCSMGKTFVGERCRLQCHPGHVPIGKAVAVCTANEQWSTNTTLDCIPTKYDVPVAPPLIPPTTIRETPFEHAPVTTKISPPARPQFGFGSSSSHTGIKRPFIKCPRNTTVYLAHGEMTAHIILQKPVTNLDFRYIESYPAWTKELQAHLAAGTYVITFRGQDPETGLRARCQTVITVRRVEPPKIIFCTPSFAVTLSPNQAYRSIVWEEPRFEGENSKGLKKTYKSRIPGELFGVGIHTVYYEATNEEGQTSRCEFKIIVRDAASASAPDVPIMHYGYPQNKPQEQPVISQRDFLQNKPLQQPVIPHMTYAHNKPQKQPMIPQMNYAMTHATHMASAQLLPGHESFIICPGQRPVKVTQTHSVNLPAECMLKNVRIRPMRRRMQQHQRRVFHSLWAPYSGF